MPVTCDEETTPQPTQHEIDALRVIVSASKAQGPLDPMQLLGMHQIGIRQPWLKFHGKAEELVEMLLKAAESAAYSFRKLDAEFQRVIADADHTIAELRAELAERIAECRTVAANAAQYEIERDRARTDVESIKSQFEAFKATVAREAVSALREQ